MKKAAYVLVALLLLMATQARSQMLEYYSFGTDAGHVEDMAKTHDGGVAFLVTNLIYATQVVRTDAAGNVLWQRQIYFPDMGAIWAIVETDDHGLATLSASTSGDIVVNKLDSAGNYAWMRSYYFSATNEGWGLASNADSGVVIVGNGCAGNNFAIYTDGNGDIQWARTYLHPTLPTSAATHIIRASDDEFIVTGLTADSIPGVVHLQSISRAGALNWYKTYAIGGRHPWPWGLVKAAEGGYTLAGYTEGSSTQDGFLLHVDDTGGLVWVRSFTPTTFMRFFALMQLPNHDYIAGGYLHYASTLNAQALLVCTDSLGNPRWMRSTGNETFSGVGLDYIDCLLGMDGSQYLAAGGSDGKAIWMMDDSVGMCQHTDENLSISSPAVVVDAPIVSPNSITFLYSTAFGSFSSPSYVKNVICSTPLSAAGPALSSHEARLSVSPNPAADLLTVAPDRWAEMASSVCTFVNAAGQSYSLPIDPAGRIDIHMLPMGLYQLRIPTQAGKALTAKILVQR